MKHPIDVHVGMKIRQQRWVMGITQQQLAEQVGIKFQQIQKYETGMNRVSASRLWEISKVLEVPIQYFFAGAEGSDEPGQDLEDIIQIDDKETATLIRFYRQIPEKQRRKLFDLAQTLSSTE